AKLLHYGKGRYPEAKDACRQAEELMNQLVAAHPEVPEYQADLVRSRTGWCDATQALGGHREAESVYRQLEPVLVRLATDSPKEEEYSRQLAALYHNIALSRSLQGRLEEAVDSFRQAATRYEMLLAAAPGVPSFRADQANTLMQLGMALLQVGRP